MTCYLERSKVRELLIEQPDESLHITEQILAEVDALPIVTAEDILGAAQAAPDLKKVIETLHDHFSAPNFVVQQCADELAKLAHPTQGGDKGEVVAPEPYEAPFAVRYSGIQDAKGRYVAELSNPYGTVVRDAMVRFIVDAMNAAPQPASNAGGEPTTIRDFIRTGILKFKEHELREIVAAFCKLPGIAPRSLDPAYSVPDCGKVQKIAADAIRTFCQSLGSASVQMSHGQERIYYAGISLDALSVAVALALTSTDREAGK